MDDTTIKLICSNISQIQSDVRKISDTLHGNGKEGIVTTVSKNRSFRHAVQRRERMLWGGILSLFVGFVLILLKLYL